MFFAPTLRRNTVAMILTTAVAVGTWAGTALGQYQVQVQFGPQPVYAPAPTVVPLLNDEQLDQLAAPIALYPDPLVAVILPAATYPDELAAAADMLQRYNMSPAAIDGQPWESSIKSLAHSPSVLIWMANNRDWTNTLGTAFAYQPQDVMESIQHLRAQAAAVGTLYNTPQQIVVYQDRYICIEPAVVDVVYVPVYDWRVCYTRRYEPTFFAGLNIGIWLDHDCDWDDNFITIGARWDRGWDHRWDDDRNARTRSVNVTTVNNTTVNRTTVNNTTVAGAAREVKVGGTQWKRDSAKPAAALPASVKPAAQVPIEKAPVRTRVARTERTAEGTPAPTRSVTPTIRNDTGTPGARNPSRETPTAAPQPDKPVTPLPPARGRDTAPPARGRAVDAPPVDVPHVTPPPEPPARGRDVAPPARGRDETPPARGRGRGDDRGN